MTNYRVFDPHTKRIYQVSGHLAGLDASVMTRANISPVTTLVNPAGSGPNIVSSADASGSSVAPTKTDYLPYILLGVGVLGAIGVGYYLTKK